MTRIGAMGAVSDDRVAQVLDTLLGEVVAWSQALAPLRHVTQGA
jgi:hypothetical protein